MIQVAEERAAHNANLRREHIHSRFDRIVRCANGLSLYEQTPARQSQIAPLAVAVEDPTQCD